MVHNTKTGKNVPNENNMYQMVIKYPQCPLNIPNGHKIYKLFLIKGPPKFTQIWIFCLKINHLATLDGSSLFHMCVCMYVGGVAVSFSGIDKAFSRLDQNPFVKFMYKRKKFWNFTIKINSI
jgi:hypothetical protein